MPAGAGEQGALDWLGQAIIASQSKVATLARQRMSGLPHQSMSRAEQLAYGVGEDTRLFVVQAAGEWFDPEQRFCLIVPGQAAQVGPGRWCCSSTRTPRPPDQPRTRTCPKGVWPFTRPSSARPP